MANSRSTTKVSLTRDMIEALATNFDKYSNDAGEVNLVVQGHRVGLLHPKVGIPFTLGEVRRSEHDD